MTSHAPFPERIEADCLVFERFGHDNVDPFEFYTFVTKNEWQKNATEHMPWFRFQRLDEIVDFVDRAEQQWADCETARYLLRLQATGEIIGTTAYGPEWETRRAGSGIVLSQEYWGNEYGLERASAFIELTFETYDLDAYYGTCAAGNEPSRRMIEKYTQKYGGQYEGLLRHHSSRPDGNVTDQHRFTILRSEYEDAMAELDTMQFDTEW
jgi:RimJ/RimL family protein N-acetyltransferase